MKARTITLAGMLLATVSPAALAQETEIGRSTTTMDRIVVSAGAEKVAIDTPQSVSVVDQEDLDTEQATTIGDAITDLPGVKAVGSDRVLGESFNIRGFGAPESPADENRLIITVDGAQKFYEQYRMGSLFTDPELYKRIEVLRGPASSTLYGSGALAGAINLTTKDASDFLRDGEDYTLRQKFGFNSNRHGFLTSTIGAAEPVENFEVVGALNYRRSGSFEDGHGDEISGSAFRAESGLMKGKYTFGDDLEHEVKASYQLWHTDSSGQDYAQTGTSSGFGTIDREVTDQTMVFGYGYTPVDNDLIDADVTMSYTSSQNEQDNASEDLISTSQIYDPITYDYEIWTLRAQNTASFTGEGYENFLTAGVEYVMQERTADKESTANSGGTAVSIHPGGEGSRIGIFVQNEFIWNDTLTLIPGIRVDWQELEAADDVFGNNKDFEASAVSPKLAAMYKLNKNWGVFGSVAYTERMPVIDELYDGGSGNADLGSERSLNYEGGVSMSLDNVALERDALSAKGTVFLNKVDDLIERATRTAPYRNVGEAEIKGVELEASYNSDYFYSRAAYTMIRGEDTETDAHLDTIPADELALTVGGRMPEYDLDFGWRGVFAREQTKFSSTFTTPSDGYVVHDVYVNWTPDEGYLKDAEFRFGVDNVMDKAYREFLANDQAKGRTFKLTLAKQF